MLRKDLLIQKILDNDHDTKSADFATMDLDDADIKRLVRGIAKNTRLEFISLFESNIRQKHLKPLYDAVMANTHLKTLKIQKYSDYSRLSKSLIDLMCEHVKSNNHRMSMKLK